MAYLQYAVHGRDGFLAYYSSHAQVGAASGSDGTQQLQIHSKHQAAFGSIDHVC